MNAYEFIAQQAPNPVVFPQATAFFNPQAGRDTERGFIWLDCSYDEVSAAPEAWAELMRQQLGVAIDELHLTDILNLSHPSVFDLTDDYEFLIIRSLVWHEHASPTAHTAQTSQGMSPTHLHTAPVVFIITPQALITVRASEDLGLPRTVRALRARVASADAQGKPPSPRLSSKHTAVSPLELSLKLLNDMIDRYLDLRAPLTAQVQNWQTELLQGQHRFTRWAELLQENMALQKLEYLCDEQMDALQELYDFLLDEEHSNELVHPMQRRDLLLVRLRDLLNHANRVENHASRLQNALKSAVDLHFSAAANQTNEAMRFLAIVTSLFAPLTLLTGIFGMNFDVIPGLHNPYGFWFSLLAMIISTLSLLWYFKRRSLVGRGRKSVVELLGQPTDDLI